MVSFKFPSFLHKIIEELSIDKSNKSIWLVGSRADNRANDLSDWDLLVFSDKELVKSPRRHKEVDVIIVSPSSEALVEGNSLRQIIKFKNWGWVEADNNSANYTGLKFIDYPHDIRDSSEPVYEISQNKAHFLWRRV